MKKQVLDLQSRRLPLVSVVMPVYNGSRFVEKTIESVLKQTYPRLEFIVVDDGSTDATWKILKEYRRAAPNTLRLYRFAQNQGEAAAANFAISKSKGKYLARIDADDLAQASRIAKQVSFMEANPDVIVLGTRAKIIDARGQRIGKKFVPLAHRDIYQCMSFFNPMIHPSLMYRKALLPKRGQLYCQSLRSANDYNSYFKLLQYGKFANLPQELVAYRIHGANKSLQNLKEKFWIDTKIRLQAIAKYSYKAPVMMFPAIILQALLVLLLPESVLREIFFYLRGLKKIQLHYPTVSLRLIGRTMRRYAPAVR